MTLADEHRINLRCTYEASAGRRVTIDQDCSGLRHADDNCFVDADQDGDGTDVGTTVTLGPTRSAAATPTARPGLNRRPSRTTATTAVCNTPIRDPGCWRRPPDDGIDQDCNGFDTVTCFVDADQDGFGTNAPTVLGTTTTLRNGCDAAPTSESTTVGRLRRRGRQHGSTRRCRRGGLTTVSTRTATASTP